MHRHVAKRPAGSAAGPGEHVVLRADERGEHGEHDRGEHADHPRQEAVARAVEAREAAGDVPARVVGDEQDRDGDEGAGRRGRRRSRRSRRRRARPAARSGPRRPASRRTPTRACRRRSARAAAPGRRRAPRVRCSDGAARRRGAAVAVVDRRGLHAGAVRGHAQVAGRRRPRRRAARAAACRASSAPHPSRRRAAAPGRTSTSVPSLAPSRPRTVGPVQSVRAAGSSCRAGSGSVCVM